MKEKAYFSIRMGKNKKGSRIDLPLFLKLFHSIYSHFEREGYFQEYFGYECVDSGFNPGKFGHEIEGELIIALRKDNLWPISDHINKYSEDDVFDLIEFLCEYCSKPTKRTFHSWCDCGWHCSEFDSVLGREEFRIKINKILNIYSSGYELSPEGEILTLPEKGLDDLIEAPLPVVDPENIGARIESARAKFRRYKASIDERRDSIRDLADVLEYLRPKIKNILTTKDENDIFNLANNFGIRHHNELQKMKYDKAIWYSWLFYYYLATIHAVLRLIEKTNVKKIR